MLCSEWDGCKPDITVLGKALSGGTMPVSAVLANDEVGAREEGGAGGAEPGVGGGGVWLRRWRCVSAACRHITPGEESPS